LKAVNQNNNQPANRIAQLERLLRERIVIIDGAMGTMIQTYKLDEAAFRGERFKDSVKDLKGNNDVLNVTRPQVIEEIHRKYLEAGADIIETNTFGATSIAQSEFFVDDPREHGGRKDPEFYQKIIDDPFLGNLALEINERSARQCREWADRVGNATSRQRFVAGAIGPLTVSLSNSPDADDAGFRVVTFDQVKTAYAQQVRGLMAGGADLLLVETIFDSLNAKAALVAIREVFDQDGKNLPVMILHLRTPLSMTAFVIDMSGCRGHLPQNRSSRHAVSQKGIFASRKIAESLVEESSTQCRSR